VNDVKLLNVLPIAYSVKRTKLDMSRIRLCLLLLVGLVQVSWAGELHVIINGKAIHLDKGDYNENNRGLGFEYDFARRGNWIPFTMGSFFKDSHDRTSRYLGGGLKRRYQLENADDGWHLDAGVVAFLMTRYDYKNNNPFPGILPFASLGKQWASLNATYIPRVSPKHKQLLFFQLMFRIAEF